MEVTFLIAENCFASGVAGMLDAMTIANLWQRELTGREKPLFTSKMVSPNGSPVRCGSVELVADASLAAVEDAEYVIIPPFVPIPRWNTSDGERLTGWLTARHRDSVPIAALCTGTFLLAETGLLDGRKATTNWQFVRSFQRRYPAVQLRPEELITEENGLVCTGAATAYLNFALALIERYGSRDLARVCAKALLVDSNRTSQAPYYLDIESKKHKDEMILRAQQYLEENCASIMSVEEVAAYVGISSRHFKRRFKLATGSSPLFYLQNLRIELAKKKLESSLDSIDEITQQIGYENSSTFRRLFRQRVNLSPREYREKFSRRLGG